MEDDDRDDARLGSFGVFDEAGIGVDELLIKWWLLIVRDDFGTGGEVFIHDLDGDGGVGLEIVKPRGRFWLPII